MRLLIVGERGDTRSVVLSRLVTRYRESRPESPALAVEPTQLHAYVVTDRLVADVDLAQMETTYHAAPASSRVTPSDFGYYRRAFWLGKGRLVIGGATTRFFTTRAVGALGAYIIDTRSWSRTVLDASAGELSYVGRRLVIIGRRGIRIIDAMGGVQTVRDPCETPPPKQPLVNVSGDGGYLYLKFIGIFSECNEVLAVRFRGSRAIAYKADNDFRFTHDFVIARGS